MSNMDRIPSFSLARNFKRVESEIREAVDRVFETQQFILGEDVREFEREMSAYLEVPRTVSCASGTDALVIAVKALGIGPGDEVITTPFSFFATASCITRAGAVPVFADVDLSSYNVLPEMAKELVTPKTKAFIPVHLFGQQCVMEDVTSYMKERGIAVIEDCAQAIGAHRLHDGKIMRSGMWGDAGCFSFFPTKNLGAYGDAGMITAYDDALADRCARLRVHGESGEYIHDEVGFNSRMDSIQAAVLRVRLRHLEEWTEERREAARRYALLIGEMGLLDDVTPPAETPGNRHTYHQYVIRAKRRDDLKRHLDEHGIASRVYYPLSLHMQPCFSECGLKRGDRPNSERLCDEVLALPMFPELTEDEQERTVSAIRSFYRGK